MAVKTGPERAMRTPSPKKSQTEQDAETIPGRDRRLVRPGRERGLSLEQVLTAFRGIRKRTISKDDISRPVLDHRYPIIVHSPLVPLGRVSQSPSPTHTITPPLTLTPSYSTSTSASPTPPEADQAAQDLSAPSSSAEHKRVLVRWNSAPTEGLDTCYFAPTEPDDVLKWLSDPRHTHAYPRLESATPLPPKRHPSSSARDRRNRNKALVSPLSKPGRLKCIGPPSPPPSNPPPPLPEAALPQSKRSDTERDNSVTRRKQFRSPKSPRLNVGERLDVESKKLSRISEASQEPEYSRAQRCTLRLLATMESIRASLQPPANVGTKARAIQQAQEMELLVSERAKRAGEEPPPYDFLELIGKGAYGRVFKGYALR